MHRGGRPDLTGSTGAAAARGSYSDSKLFVTTLAAAVARLLAGCAQQRRRPRLGAHKDGRTRRPRRPAARSPHAGMARHQRRPRRAHLRRLLAPPAPDRAAPRRPRPRGSRTNCSTTSLASPARASPDPGRSQLQGRVVNERPATAFRRRKQSAPPRVSSADSRRSNAGCLLLSVFQTDNDLAGTRRVHQRRARPGTRGHDDTPESSFAGKT